MISYHIVCVCVFYNGLIVSAMLCRPSSPSLCLLGSLPPKYLERARWRTRRNWFGYANERTRWSVSFDAAYIDHVSSSSSSSSSSSNNAGLVDLFYVAHTQVTEGAIEEEKNVTCGWSSNCHISFCYHQPAAAAAVTALTSRDTRLDSLHRYSERIIRANFNDLDCYYSLLFFCIINNLFLTIGSIELLSHSDDELNLISSRVSLSLSLSLSFYCNSGPGDCLIIIIMIIPLSSLPSSSSPSTFRLNIIIIIIIGDISVL